MKDEAGSKIITHFIALRAKSYAFKILDEVDENGNSIDFHQKCKGVTKAGKKEIQFEDYYNSMMSEDPEKMIKHVAQNRIVSQIHQVTSQSSTKIALSGFDDKRCVVDRVHCFTQGHYLCQNLTEEEKKTLIKNKKELPK